MEEKNEISFAFLFRIFKRRILWLLLAAVLCAGLAFSYSKFLAKPVYSSSAEFVVQINSSGLGSTSSGYLAGAQMIAKNHVQIVQGNIFLGKVAQAYNERHNASLDVKTISKRLTVIIVTDTSAFRVKVSGDTPEDARELLRVFEEMIPDYLNENRTEGTVDVKAVSYGSLAKKPDSPHVMRNALLAGIVGLVFCYLGFFLQAFLDKRIYDENTLKTQFQMPVVGLLPEWQSDFDHANRFWMRKKRNDTRLADPETLNRIYKGRLLDVNTPFSIVESFKTLRTNLTYIVPDEEKCPVFGITSCFAGAGKSLVIANVAVTFAQLGKKVLLIDGDMRCPVQTKIFGMGKNHAGLSEALAGISKDALSECIYADVKPGLDLMVGGRIPPNPSELLSSERMKKLLDSARAKYDYILMDLPPVLETADAGVLAPLLSGYILLVRAGSSDVPSVQSALDTLDAMHGHVVGFVLNDINLKAGYGSYYHYGKYSKYGYSKGYGRQSEETAATEIRAGEKE